MEKQVLISSDLEIIMISYRGKSVFYTVLLYILGWVYFFWKFLKSNLAKPYKLLFEAFEVIGSHRLLLKY